MIDNREIKEIFSLCGMPLCGVVTFSEELFRRAGRKEDLFSHIRDPKSLIVSALPYFGGEYSGGNLAKFATVPDYMVVFGKKLSQSGEILRLRFGQNAFAPLCNVDPLAEVSIAQRAGLGRRGRHNLLITPEYGSYVVLGLMATDLEIQPSPPLAQTLCIDCKACVSACPNGALDGEGGFERQRCLAHINQKNGELEPWQLELMLKNDRLWGCDICQDACPLNQGVKGSFVPEFTQGERKMTNLTGKEVEGLSKEEFARRYADRVFLSKNPDNILRNLRWF